MLDADTKRLIDTARDILVGKVPDPKSQVEQITIALIYKCMDDIDAGTAMELGRRAEVLCRRVRSSTAGPSSCSAGLSVADDILRSLRRGHRPGCNENPGIPPLFRSIFDNAYLPYRDPETLRAFLKVIDEFTYDYSERMGDAFEYLLSDHGRAG